MSESDCEPTAALRRPNALRPGDRVAVLSASSPTNLERLPVGLDTLTFAGFEPVLFSTARERGTVHHFLAGSDELRATELRAALVDDTIKGVLFAGGGYGAQRTLEQMDWSGLDRIEPKVLAGYSDVTAILEAVAVKLGWTSVMGPMVAEGEFAESYSFASLLRCLTSPETMRSLRFDDAITVTPGSVQGMTVGGNLSLVAGSVGTDTSRPASGGILLLEDEQEDDARIDTMITHLRRSGYLDGVAAIVCGTWNNCGTREQIQPILIDRLGDLGVPMIAWANLGHDGHVQSFPIGIRAELDADARTLTLLEPPLRPAQAGNTG
ncbi:MAG: S66 peptidase family protein [Nocardioidaceae bacterium]